MYAESLVTSGIMSQDEVSKIISEHSDWLNDHFKQIESYQPERSNLKENWASLTEPSSSITTWDTGLSDGNLKVNYLVIIRIEKGVSRINRYNLYSLFQTFCVVKKTTIKMQSNLDIMNLA